jgi:penicillin-binding protein 1A
MAARRRSPPKSSSKKPRKAATGHKGRAKTGAKPAKTPRPWRLYWRITKWSTIVLLWLVVIAAGFVAYYAHDLPDTDQLAGPETPMSVTVLAADGTTIANYGELWGELVPATEMAPVLPQAVLAIEDRRFFEHGGIDIFGVIRAAWRNAVEGRLVEGGSTISQQVAKLVFLSPERSVKRKIQEAMLAYWLEREFSKEEILTIYLNRAYFGAGAYGVDAAARRLSLPQAALIAGLLRAPSRYSPASNPALAKQRAGVVLDAMADAGFLTVDEADGAKQQVARLPIAPSAGSSARYFADWILEQVPGFVGREHGALRVLTTLDPVRQEAAEQAVAATLDRDGDARDIGEAALVALDRSGAVRAMVGGRSYRKSQFNRATQARRQPGSAFKPLVYLAAIEAGLSPEDVIEDAPITIADWSPRNYDQRFRGPMTVRDAFAQSINTVAVRVGQHAGVDRMLATARKLGIESDLPADASLALGTGEVSLIELTAAYGAFANDGVRVLPHGIAEIRNRAGDVLYRRTGSGAGKAIAPAPLTAMRDLLSAAVTDGTGRAAILLGGLVPSYGKTGTSQQFRDAWFVGWAGNLVAGVWVGNDDGAAMDRVTGGTYPAALWHEFMTVALP